MPGTHCLPMYGLGIMYQRGRLAILAFIVLIAACGTGPSSQATTGTSSSVSPGASSKAIAPAVAVVEWDQGVTGYTLSLVSADAKILATVHAVWPYGGKCGPVEAGIISPPPVSTSNSRAYYLDSGGIKWLQEDGKTGLAFGALQAHTNSAIAFAVAPDDTVFALNTIDYTASPLTQRLTVTRVGAKTLGAEIYSATSPASTPSSAVWPAGWHGGNLVLAYHRSTCTQGGGPGLGDPSSYHVVNASTATRTATIGQDSLGACGFVGFPSPAGIPCAGYFGGNTQILTWTGAPGGTFGASFPGGLSPTGTAYVGTVQSTAASQGVLTLISPGGSANPLPGDAGPVMWIDDLHFFVGASGTGSGATPLGQARVYSISPLQATPVTVPGIPVARIPGNL